MSLYLQELADGGLRVVFDDRRGSGYAQWDRAGVLLGNQCDVASPGDHEPSDRPCGTCGNTPAQQPSTPANSPTPNVFKGIIGLTKAHAGFDKADDATMSERQSICEQCEQNDLGRCQKCGCYLWAKVRVASERCPAGKW